KIDYSLLLDGLIAEREQGITIDVAYRYFNTEKRSFIVADTPGHEEYTRNMAVGASFADLAIILVDAKQGVLIQTRRHSRICSLMGIKNFIFAVNKMDLVDYSEERFKEVTKQIQEIIDEIKLSNVQIIPISATEGDNVTKKSLNMDWYNGPTILAHLEDVDIAGKEFFADLSTDEKKFYMPIQRVCRPNHEFRGFQGQIEEGNVHVGDEITTLPSGEKAKVKKIINGFNEVQSAKRGQAGNISLDREVDVSRGCVFEINTNLKLTNFVTATLLWMDDSKLENGKNFFVKIGTKQLSAVVTGIQYAIDVNSGKHKKIDSLSKNEIAVVDISFSDLVVADEFKKHKVLGELILIDRITNMTSACGVIKEIHLNGESKYSSTIDNKKRAGLKGQTAKVFEFFLGKNGVTNDVLQKIEKRLYDSLKHTYLYTPVVGEDYANVVHHLLDAGIIVLLALDEHLVIDKKLQNEESYVRGIQKNLVAINVDDVANQIKKISSEVLGAGEYSI
nr:GTP-binding protein [Treponema sp.]